MFCVNCGVEIEKTHNFCPKCGTEKAGQKDTSGSLPSNSTSPKSMIVIGIGFVIGVITIIAIVGAVNTATDPYGCTQCDPFLPGYDGPPPIEAEIWVPDDYYYDDYYYP